MWNFNMDEAPKNRTIIAASKCKKVIVSRWIEEGQRWNMFSKDHPPIAWQDYPGHPYADQPESPQQNLEQSQAKTSTDRERTSVEDMF